MLTEKRSTQAYHPAPPPQRSLRAIRIQYLRDLLRDVVRQGYLSTGTGHYAAAERQAWIAGGDRDPCVAATAREIEAEIATLEATSDEEYRVATVHLPLDYWPMTLEQIGPHVHARGIEGRVCTGPGEHGWGWYRVGSSQRLSGAEAAAVIGDDAWNNLAARIVGAASSP